MQLRFPLPAGYFPNVELSEADVAYYKALVTDLVRETRRDYDRFVKEQRKNVDSGVWKLSKSKDRLHVYRRRPQHAAQQMGLYSENTIGAASTHSYSSSESFDSNYANSVSSGNFPRHKSRGPRASSSVSSNSLEDDHSESKRSILPSVLGVGVMDGSLDDVIYGLHKVTTDEWKMMNTFQGDDTFIDCAVLDTIKHSKSTYLGLKWQLNRTVGGNRDMCYLEYVGISVDSKGMRYGYHVMESVQLPTCPPFEDKSIVRTNMSFCYLFKESEPGTVEVFLQGAFDSSADALTAGGVGDSRSAMGMLMSISKAIESADMKKIASLVAKQAQAPPKRQDMSLCTICRSKSSFMSSHILCQGCGDVICTKCRVRKIIYNRRGKQKVSCCKICVVNVANTSPFPQEPRVQSQQNHQSVVKSPVKSANKEIPKSSSRKESTPKLTRTPTNSSNYSTATTEYSSSISSYQSNSVSSSLSEYDEQYLDAYRAQQHGAYGASTSVALVDPPMPAVKEMPSEYDNNASRHLSNVRVGQYGRYGPPPPVPSRSTSTSSNGSHGAYNNRADLYSQMLELQMAADKAYTLANQNAVRMRNYQ